MCFDPLKVWYLVLTYVWKSYILLMQSVLMKTIFNQTCYDVESMLTLYATLLSLLTHW